MQETGHFYWSNKYNVYKPFFATVFTLDSQRGLKKKRNITIAHAAFI